MQNIIVARRQLLPSSLCALLPPRLCREVEETVPAGSFPEELRLRRGRAASVTVSGRNLRLSAVLSGKEIDDLFFAMCEGSLYAHSETVCQGYLSLKGGIRVGVCGKAGVVNGKITGIFEPASLAIRIPHATPPLGGEIATLLRQMSLCKGVLLYAPPGVGKTTVLRGIAAQMAGGDHPLRVAIVDTRGELFYSLEGVSLLLDLLSGYPRGKGISIAARTLAAQLIVCDEIGDLGEAQEIVEAHNCGVPLLATAHAADVNELLCRPGMRLLHEAKCFGAYVRLYRRAGEFLFGYDVTDWEAADGLL
ncbi:MAG: AAA family ATPase [Ruminococcaceae bacterium]|nr:AAA family ATPase [Oscillospiraceae bacterium]